MLQKREEYAVVLDFLPNGYPSDPRPLHMKPSIAQAIGKETFILLELVAKRGVFLQPHETVYIGSGKREKIHHIVGRIPMEKLTSTAKTELEPVIVELVKEQEKRFVEFFNKAGPITTRMHSLELIPGIGKKHMWEILEKREEKSFTSLKDIEERVKGLADLEKAIAKRIIQELEGKEKHYLFVPPMKRKE